MKNGNYTSLKDLLKSIQFQQLDRISRVVLAGTFYNVEQIPANNSVNKAAEIRRKICYVARLKYNITGNNIADFLRISFESVSHFIYSAHSKCDDQTYQKQIDDIIKKLDNA